MEISLGMIRDRLHLITNDYVLDGVFPEEVEKYNDLISEIKQYVAWDNDTEPFRLAMNYYLCHPEIDLEDLFSYPFTMEDDLLRKVIRHMMKIIWNQDGVNCEEVKSIVIVNTTVDEWWEMRKEQGLHPSNNEN
jgi:hypothetical protein